MRRGPCRGMAQRGGVMRFEDIARRLKVSVRTVYGDYRRAVRKLRKAKEEYESSLTT